MSSAWENCAESCNLIFAPTLSARAVPFASTQLHLGKFLWA